MQLPSIVTSPSAPYTMRNTLEFQRGFSVLLFALIELLTMGLMGFFAKARKLESLAYYRELISIREFI